MYDLKQSKWSHFTTLNQQNAQTCWFSVVNLFFYNAQSEQY